MRPLLYAFATALPLAAQACPDGQRVFDHEILEGGATCIPAAPDDIAFLHTNAITAHLLGQKPIVANYYLRAFFETYPGAIDQAEFDSLLYFPKLDLADLEAVIATDADLYAGMAWAPQANAKLAQAVPLVVAEVEDGRVGWRDFHDFTAALLDKEQEGDEMLAAVDARLARLRDAIGADGARFTVVRTMDQTEGLQVFTSEIFGAELTLAAGLQMDPDVLDPEASAAVGRTTWYQLPLERVQDLNTDHLILMEGWEPEIEKQVLASPLWQALPVVAEGRVIRAFGNGEQWIRPNAAFAHLVIDDLYRGVLGLEPAEIDPNPFAAWLEADQ